MIFRAIAYSTEPAWSGEERVVYVEASEEDLAKQKLQGILAALWEVPVDSVEWYNFSDQTELLRNALGSIETGDWRYFEIGSAFGHPVYAGGEDHPLLFLDRELNRFTAAYMTLPHRGELGLKLALGKLD